MTLDDLVRIAWDAYDNQHTEWDAMRSAVLAVLDAVERECVPPEAESQTFNNFERMDAWNDCRNQMLDRLAEMRK